MEDGHYINETNDEVWVQNGKYHRLDGPAKIWEDNVQFWYQNGVLHRDDGPACIYKNGAIDYWFSGIQYNKIRNDVQWLIEVQKIRRQER